MLLIYLTTGYQRYQNIKESQEIKTFSLCSKNSIFQGVLRLRKSISWGFVAHHEIPIFDLLALIVPCLTANVGKPAILPKLESAILHVGCLACR